VGVSGRFDIAEKRPELSPTDRRLSLALAAAPIAWLLQLGIGHALVPAMCRSGNRLPLHALTVLALAIAAAGFAYCWRHRGGEGMGHEERSGRHGGADPWSKTARLSRRALAWTGVGLAVFFALLIVVLDVPGLVLEPCQQ
jgi:hypothetical protein